MPLGIVTLTPSDFFGVPTVVVVFDALARCVSIPFWQPDAGDLVGAIAQSGGPSETWHLAIDGPMPTEIVVGVDTVGFTSMSGGFVVPGTYLVT